MMLREPSSTGAETMRWRPRTLIGTARVVVSKTLISAASPRDSASRSGDVKYAMPPYDVDAK
jgi:hypothetical protein